MFGQSLKVTKLEKLAKIESRQLQTTDNTSNKHRPPWQTLLLL